MELKFKEVILKPFNKSLLRGMSLIEIIIVIALIGTIMSIIISKITTQQDEAMNDAARLAMSRLQQSLDMYRVHNHRYPGTDEGLQALVTSPANAKNWRGPYVEAEKLKDPWGSNFGYESDGRKFKIISPGLDEKQGTEDDVIYPEEQAVTQESK